MLESLFLKPRRLETRAASIGARRTPRVVEKATGGGFVPYKNTLPFIIAPTRSLKRGERNLFPLLFSIFSQKVADVRRSETPRSVDFRHFPHFNPDRVYLVGVGSPISRIKSCKSAQASFFAGGLRSKYAG